LPAANFNVTVSNAGPDTAKSIAVLSVLGNEVTLGAPEALA
jgi:hypothetical protein